MTHRVAQQIRLWLYVVMFQLDFFGVFTIVNFIYFALIMMLFYLEICPTCGRLVWWETKKWPNTFWISSKCRNVTMSSGDDKH